MTPKGVEHFAATGAMKFASNVKIPMTPKGVEHFKHSTRQVAFHSCEDSNDAERR